MMNNIQLYNLAKSYLKQGGSTFRSFCGLPSGAAYCAAYVSYIFYKGGDASLFFGGKRVTYVPTAEKWLFANCANIPIYLAMPMDVITFDWNKNGVPDHIGFVRDRKSDTEVYTIEGNTSGGIVDTKTRPVKYVSGCFRTQFAPSSAWTTTKPLTIDGQFGYNSIACLQKALGVKIDAVLGKQTVKALQKRVGVAQDGSWGTKTSKAVQKMIGVKQDGWFGINSVKALQKWINKQNSANTTKPVTKDRFDKANEWAVKLCNSVNGKYKVFGDDVRTQHCPICDKKAFYGYNCIGAAFAYWRHGAGIPCRCNCEVINDTMMDRLLRSNHATAVELVKQCTGLTAVTVVSNGGKPIPVSSLKKGDIIIYYEGNTSAHMGVHIGGGKLFDCARGHNPQMQCGKLNVDWWTKTNGWQVKIAIRFTGK